jgi:hypothetical protein
MTEESKSKQNSSSQNEELTPTQTSGNKMAQIFRQVFVTREFTGIELTTPEQKKGEISYP